jgi:nitrous oxidase accessory protein NosD
MKRRAAVVLFAALAAIGLSLAPAGATGRSHHGHRGVLVVDNQHRHRSCLGTRDPFQTINDAIDDEDAVPGATIWVCPGLYQENVVVQTPRLTFLGANAGKDPTGEERGHESIVTGDDPKGTVQLDADQITWNGFTIQGVVEEENGPGIWTSPAHSGYLVRDTIFQDNGVGVHLGSSGEFPTLICRNRFQANNEFAEGGFGVFSDEGASDVAITWNRFQLHNGAGVFFADRGATQQDVLIAHNKSVDDKTFAAIYNTSRVRVSSNRVRARVDDPEFPEETSAIFIGARNDDVLVKGNRVKSASGNGIDVSPSPEPNRGLLPAAPTNVTIARNKAAGARLAGLHMAAGTADVAVTANTALDNTIWDCQDESTGVQNTWTGNFGVTSSPDHLCAPPPPPTDEPHHGKGHHHKKKHKKKKDPCACEQHPKAY